MTVYAMVPARMRQHQVTSVHEKPGNLPRQPLQTRIIHVHDNRRTKHQVESLAQ